MGHAVVGPIDTAATLLANRDAQQSDLEQARSELSNADDALREMEFTAHKEGDDDDLTERLGAFRTQLWPPMRSLETLLGGDQRLPHEVASWLNGVVLAQAESLHDLLGERGR